MACINNYQPIFRSWTDDENDDFDFATWNATYGSKVGGCGSFQSSMIEAESDDSDSSDEVNDEYDDEVDAEDNVELNCENDTEYDAERNSDSDCKGKGKGKCDNNAVNNANYEREGEYNCECRSSCGNDGDCDYEENDEDYEAYDVNSPGEGDWACAPPENPCWYYYKVKNVEGKPAYKELSIYRSGRINEDRRVNYALTWRNTKEAWVGGIHRPGFIVQFRLSPLSREVKFEEDEGEPFEEEVEDRAEEAKEDPVEEEGLGVPELEEDDSSEDDKDLASTPPDSPVVELKEDDPIDNQDVSLDNDDTIIEFQARLRFFATRRLTASEAFPKDSSDCNVPSSKRRPKANSILPLRKRKLSLDI